MAVDIVVIILNLDKTGISENIIYQIILLAITLNDTVALNLSAGLAIKEIIVVQMSI